MDIKELREKINGIDEQLTALFIERMELVRGVAEYKREHNLPIRDASREQEILKSLSVLAGNFRATSRLFSQSCFKSAGAIRAGCFGEII